MLRGILATKVIMSFILLYQSMEIKLKAVGFYIYRSNSLINLTMAGMKIGPRHFMIWII